MAAHWQTRHAFESAFAFVDTPIMSCNSPASSFVIFLRSCSCTSSFRVGGGGFVRAAAEVGRSGTARAIVLSRRAFSASAFFLLKTGCRFDLAIEVGSTQYNRLVLLGVRIAECSGQDVIYSV